MKFRIKKNKRFYMITVTIALLSLRCGVFQNSHSRSAVTTSTSNATVKDGGLEETNDPQADAEASKEGDAEPESVMLQAKQSGLCLNAGASTITQQACNADLVNMWTFKTLKSGASQLISAANNLCLSVADGVQVEGTPIVTVACDLGETAQSWDLVAQDGESFALRLADSDLCLDVSKASTAEGAELIAWKCLGKPNQMFEKKAAAESMKPMSKTQSPLKPFELDCLSDPKLEVVFKSRSWDVKMYGGNNWYYGFFSPVAAVDGTVYWVWIDEQQNVKVSTSRNGQEKAFDLAPKYRARLNSHNLFSLGIDKEGYIHVSGDMQNGPNDDNSAIEGRSGYYPEEYVGAPILYWRSKKPYDVEAGFTFLGKSSDAIPARAVNGIRFFSSGGGELFAQTASNALNAGHKPGEKGVGLYHYDLAKKSWKALGAAPEANGNPVVFWEVGGQKPTVWFQGLFTYFRFDSNDVLHFAGSINSDLNLRTHNNLVYAKSEDLGNTWKRSNGSVISKLPFRAIGDQDQRGDIVTTQTDLDWQTSVAIDGAGNPAILQRLYGKAATWFDLENSSWKSNSKINDRVKNRPLNGYTGTGNNVILVRNQEPITLFCQKTFDKPEGEFVLKDFDSLTSIDEIALRREGVVYGVAVDRDKNQHSVVKITYKKAP